MHTCLRFISLLLLALTLSATPVPSVIYRVKSGSIAFRSDAPLELIQANSTELEGLMDTQRKQFAFRVRISSFKGFNGVLQREHFNENYMESGRFPFASFEGKVIEDIDYSQSGTYALRARGNLTVHGVTQERILRVDLVVKDKIISARSAFTVLLADHNITIPKVVHEKLASEIKVEVKADLLAP